jgi:hypothetical protein
VSLPKFRVTDADVAVSLPKFGVIDAKVSCPARYLDSASGGGGMPPQGEEARARRCLP